MADSKVSFDVFSKEVYRLREKVNVLEDKIQELYVMSGRFNTSEIGSAIPHIINLNTQLFGIQSLTGATGDMSVGKLDVVYFEPSETRPQGGVGPTGADRGFWSRGSGLV
jgi:hypothetical protein